MKRFIRLAIIGILGLAGVGFYARASLSACLQTMGLRKASATDQLAAEANANYDSVLFTEWLAGDVLSLTRLPLWSSSDGSTTETMHALADLHEARQDSDALIEEHNREVKHFEAKERVFQQLVERKLNLVEAATGWLELDRSFGRNKVSIVSSIYTGKTLTERYCQRLLRELELTAKQDPHRCGPALERARRELGLIAVAGRLVTAL